MSFRAHIGLRDPSRTDPVVRRITEPNHRFSRMNVRMETDDAIEGFLACELRAGYLRVEVDGAYVNIQPEPGEPGGQLIDLGITDARDFDKQRIRHYYGTRLKAEANSLVFFRFHAKDEPVVVGIVARFTPDGR